MNFENLILPTSCFPTISWMALHQLADQLLIEIHETYPKQTLRNRYKLLAAQGVINLTIPVIKPHGNHTKTADVEIDYRTPWPRTHWRTMASAYNKSPFFQYYEHHFDQFFRQQYTTLPELNQASIELVCRILKINPKTFYTSGWQAEYALTDYRNWNKVPTMTFPPYIQVFNDRHAFASDLSILDVLFNLGPQTLHYLEGVAQIIQDKQS